MVSFSTGVVMKRIYQTDTPDSIYALQFHWYVDFNWLASQPRTAVACNFRQKVAVIMVCLITFPASRERVVQRDR